MMVMINKKELKIFLTFFIIAAIFIHWGGWYENSVFSLTEAIVDQHRFAIDSFANQTSDRAYFDGHYYSDKAPLTSVIGIPSYIFSKLVLKQQINTTTIKVFDNGKTVLYAYKNPGIFLFTAMTIYTLGTSVLFSALSIIIFYKILAYFLQNETHRTLLTLIFGFASMIFPYALSVNVQPIAGFFLLAAFYFILKEQDSRKLGNLVFAGICLGLSFTADYFVGLAALLFIVYVLFKRKSLKKTLLLFLSFSIALLPILSYNYLLLHNPFTFMQKYEDASVFSTVPQEILNSYGFQMPNIGVMNQLTLGIYRGLFVYYPVLLLSIFGLFYMKKKFKYEALFFLLIFISYLILTSARTTWQGGYTFGPRYLYYTVPFLLIVVGFTFKDFDSRFIKLIFTVLLLFSLFSNILSLQLMEDSIIDPNTLLIQSKYQVLTDSFGSLPNVLYGYYLPFFMKYGPRSMIIENLASGHFDIDIRDNPFSRDWQYPYHSNSGDIWVYPLILLVPLVVWYNEIRTLYRKTSDHFSKLKLRYLNSASEIKRK